MPRPPKEELYRLHYVEKNGSPTIASEYGVTARAVNFWFKYYNLPLLGSSHCRTGKPAPWNSYHRSPEHMEKLRQGNMGRSPSNKGSGDAVFTCLFCGKTVCAKPYRLSRTCGRECRGKLTGDKHWNWRGTADTTRRDRQSMVFKEWRTSVHKRDRFTCQKCGQVGKRLAVHHVFHFATHPSLRFMTENGCTLCLFCHRSFHRKFGTKESTHNHFSRWLESGESDPAPNIGANTYVQKA